MWMDCAILTLAAWLALSGDDCISSWMSNYSSGHQSTVAYQDGTRVWQVTEGQFWADGYDGYAP